MKRSTVIVFMLVTAKLHKKSARRACSLYQRDLGSYFPQFISPDAFAHESRRISQTRDNLFEQRIEPSLVLL